MSSLAGSEGALYIPNRPKMSSHSQRRFIVHHMSEASTLFAPSCGPRSGVDHRSNEISEAARSVYLNIWFRQRRAAYFYRLSWMKLAGRLRARIRFGLLHWRRVWLYILVCFILDSEFPCDGQRHIADQTRVRKSGVEVRMRGQVSTKPASVRTLIPMGYVLVNWACPQNGTDVPVTSCGAWHGAWQRRGFGPWCRSQRAITRWPHGVKGETP